ncbi:MAG: protein kinase [Chlamydiota bacterium]
MNPLFPQRNPLYNIELVWQKLQPPRSKVTSEEEIYCAQVMIEYLGLSETCCKAVKQFLSPKEWKPLKTAYKKTYKAYQKAIKETQNCPERGRAYYDKMIKEIKAKKVSIFTSFNPKSDLASDEKVDEVMELISKATIDIPASIAAGGELEDFVFKEVGANWNLRGRIPALFKTNALVLRASLQEKKLVCITWMQALILWKFLNEEANPQKWIECVLKDQGFIFYPIVSSFPIPKEWPFTLFVHQSFDSMIRIWTLQAVLAYLFGKKVIDRTCPAVNNLCKTLIEAINCGELDGVFSGGQRFASLYEIANTDWSELLTIKKKEGLVLYNIFLLIKRLMCKFHYKAEIKSAIITWSFYHKGAPPLECFPLPNQLRNLPEEIASLNPLFKDEKTFWESAIDLLAKCVKCEEKKVDVKFCLNMLGDFFKHPLINVAEELKKELMGFFLTSALNPLKEHNVINDYFQLLSQMMGHNLEMDEEKEEFTLERDQPLSKKEEIKTCIQAFWRYAREPKCGPFVMLEKLKRLKRITASLQDKIAFFNMVINKIPGMVLNEELFSLIAKLDLSLSPIDKKPSAVLYSCYQLCCEYEMNDNIEVFNTGELLPVYRAFKEEAENIRVRKKIGQGNYGKVFLIDHYTDPVEKAFVLKIVRAPSSNNPSIWIKKEAPSGESLGFTFNHDHLLRTTALITTTHLEGGEDNLDSDIDGTLHRKIDWEALDGDAIRASLFRYFPAMSMQCAVDLHGKFAPKIIVDLSLQLIDAIVYLHERKIAHRDIKLGNVLIGEKFFLKLIDFDTLMQTDSKWKFRKEIEIGTPAYQPPEILLEEETCDLFAADIYAFGVWLHFLLFGDIFDEMKSCSFKSDYSKIYRAVVQKSEDSILSIGRKSSLGSLGQKIYELMRDCLKIDSNKRPAAVDVQKRLNQLS